MGNNLAEIQPSSEHSNVSSSPIPNQNPSKSHLGHKTNYQSTADQSKTDHITKGKVHKKSKKKLTSHVLVLPLHIHTLSKN